MLQPLRASPARSRSPILEMEREMFFAKTDALTQKGDHWPVGPKELHKNAPPSHS